VRVVDVLHKEVHVTSLVILWRSIPSGILWYKELLG